MSATGAPGAQVVVWGARGAGRRFAPAPGARSLLSEEAQRLGLRTRDDAEREYRAQRTLSHDGDGWGAGTAWHCPVCDKDFCSVSGAVKHRHNHGCPVLRTDYYPELREGGR